MNTFAILCGILGILGYFSFIVVGTRSDGDGQGVNQRAAK